MRRTILPNNFNPQKLKESRCSSLNLVCWNLNIQDFFHTARWAYFENLATEILYIVFFAFPPTLNHSEFPCFSYLVLWQNFYVNVEKIKYRSYIAIGFSFELSAYSRDHLVSFWSISRKLRPSKYLWNDDKYSTPVNVAKLCCHCIGWNIGSISEFRCTILRSYDGATEEKTRWSQLKIPFS